MAPSTPRVRRPSRARALPRVPGPSGTLRLSLAVALAAGLGLAHPAVAGDPITGGLSDAGFEALHHHTTKKPPKVHGQHIRLAGSRAYLALPRGRHAPMPAVIVVHEWWGLNRYIEHEADRLAGLGYAALAVDLYGGKVATTPRQALALARSVDGRRARAIIKAAHRYLGRDPRIRARRVGILGWCFGGGWALRGAIATGGLDAVVMYYGQPVLDPGQLAHLGGPVLAIFGTRDPSLPADRVKAFDEALTHAGVRHSFLRYDAAHAFANPSGATFDAKAATDAWRHTTTFLHLHLDGG